MNWSIDIVMSFTCKECVGIKSNIVNRANSAFWVRSIKYFWQRISRHTEHDGAIKICRKHIYIFEYIIAFHKVYHMSTSVFIRNMNPLENRYIRIFSYFYLLQRASFFRNWYLVVYKLYLIHQTIFSLFRDLASKSLWTKKNRLKWSCDFKSHKNAHIEKFTLIDIRTMKILWFFMSTNVFSK